jgi:hypothetical protein
MLTATARSGRGSARQKARNGITVRPLFFVRLPVMKFCASIASARPA